MPICRSIARGFYARLPVERIDTQPGIIRKNGLVNKSVQSFGFYPRIFEKACAILFRVEIGYSQVSGQQ